MDGTCTGEHGIGLGKIKYMLSEHGPETIGVMRAIKQTLDPHNVAEPGQDAAGGVDGHCRHSGARMNCASPESIFQSRGYEFRARSRSLSSGRALRGPVGSSPGMTTRGGPGSGPTQICL